MRVSEVAKRGNQLAIKVKNQNVKVSFGNMQHQQHHQEHQQQHPLLLAISGNNYA